MAQQTAVPTVTMQPFCGSVHPQLQPGYTTNQPGHSQQLMQYSAVPPPPDSVGRSQYTQQYGFQSASPM